MHSSKYQCHIAASCTYQIWSPCCPTKAIQKITSLNQKIENVLKSGEWAITRRKEQEDQVQQESGIKWQPWDSRQGTNIRHPWPPFGAFTLGQTVLSNYTFQNSSHVNLFSSQIYNQLIHKHKTKTYDVLRTTNSYKHKTFLVLTFEAFAEERKFKNSQLPPPCLDVCASAGVNHPPKQYKSVGFKGQPPAPQLTAHLRAGHSMRDTGTLG